MSEMPLDLPLCKCGKQAVIILKDMMSYDPDIYLCRACYNDAQPETCECARCERVRQKYPGVFDSRKADQKGVE